MLGLGNLGKNLSNGLKIVLLGLRLPSPPRSAPTQSRKFLTAILQSKDFQSPQSKLSLRGAPHTPQLPQSVIPQCALFWFVFLPALLGIKPRAFALH